MSAVNLNIVAEFDLEALEKAKKKMEEIEDVFLKFSKLSKTDFAKSFEKFSRVANALKIPPIPWDRVIRIAQFIMSTYPIVKDLLKATKDTGAAAEVAKRNIDDVMKSLECRMKQGSKLANDLYDALMDWSMKLKATQAGAFMGERESLIAAFDKLIKAGYGKEFNKVYNEYLEYEKRLEESFRRVEKSKISSLEIQLHAEQDVLKAMTKVRGEYSKAAIENQKSVVKDLEDQIEGVTKASEDLATKNAALYSLMESVGLTSLAKLITETTELQKNFADLVKETGNEEAVLKALEPTIMKVYMDYAKLGKDAPQWLKGMVNETLKLKKASEDLKIDESFFYDMGDAEASPKIDQLFKDAAKFREEYEWKITQLSLDGAKLRIAELEREKNFVLDSLKEKHGAASYTYESLSKLVVEYYDKLIQKDMEAREKTISGWQQWGDWIIDFFSSIHGGIQGTYESLKTGISDIFSVFKGKETIEMGPPAPWQVLKGEDGDVGLLSKIGAALGPIGKVASVIMQIPQIVKQVWSSIKEFATSVAKLFGWMSEEEKFVQQSCFAGAGVQIFLDNICVCQV